MKQVSLIVVLLLFGGCAHITKLESGKVITAYWNPFTPPLTMIDDPNDPNWKPAAIGFGVAAFSTAVEESVGRAFAEGNKTHNNPYNTMISKPDIKIEISKGKGKGKGKHKGDDDSNSDD